MKKEEILDLIKTGEGLTVEFKENISSNLGKEMCAFANAKGGKIILGITDKGELIGIKKTNSLKSNIQSFARNMDPVFSVEIEESENIIIIHVPEGKKKPYSVNGQFFLRIGTNSQQLNRDEIREFFQKENLISFDTQPNTNFDLDKDFGKTKFDKFLGLAKITDNLSRKDILRNLFLLDGTYIKNAGVLFFCRKVTKFFLQGIVSCVLYEGKTRKNIIDKKEFDEDILSNYENTYNFIISKLNTNYIIGKEREERFELPKEAIREALINAFVHRNYFSAGHIQVDVFFDRVEISNPGGLVKGLTEKDFGKVSMPRNPLLMDLMLRAEKVERVGSGIGRIKEGMKQYNLNVDFEITADWFRVVFSRKVQVAELALQSELNERQKKAIMYLAGKERITNKEYQTFTKTTKKTATRDLNDLIAKGILKKVGTTGKGTYYTKGDIKGT